METLPVREMCTRADGGCGADGSTALLSTYESCGIDDVAASAGAGDDDEVVDSTTPSAAPSTELAIVFNHS